MMRSYASEPEIKTRDMWIDYTRNTGREAEIDFHTKAWFSEPLFFSSLLCVRGGCMGILEDKTVLSGLTASPPIRNGNDTF